MDELVDFDLDLKEIEEIIIKTDEKQEEKIDWTKAWSKKYPILAEYNSIDGMDKYLQEIFKLYENMKSEYGLSELDTMLIVKDMIYRIYKNK